MRVANGSGHEIGDEIGGIDAVVVDDDDGRVRRLAHERGKQLGRRPPVLAPADAHRIDALEKRRHHIGNALALAEAGQVEHDAAGRQALAQKALQGALDQRQPARDRGEGNDRLAAPSVTRPGEVEFGKARAAQHGLVHEVAEQCLALEEVMDLHRGRGCAHGQQGDPDACQHCESSVRSHSLFFLFGCKDT